MYFSRIMTGVIRLIILSRHGIGYKYRGIAQLELLDARIYWTTRDLLNRRCTTTGEYTNRGPGR